MDPYWEGSQYVLTLVKLSLFQAHEYFNIVDFINVSLYLFLKKILKFLNSNLLSLFSSSKNLNHYFQTETDFLHEIQSCSQQYIYETSNENMLLTPYLLIVYLQVIYGVWVIDAQRREMNDRSADYRCSEVLTSSKKLDELGLK